MTWPAGYDRRVLAEVDSTMAEATRMAPTLAGPVWVCALRQTAARGRRGRAWISPEGNFAATLALPVTEAPGTVALRSFVAALALFDAVVALTGTDCLLVSDELNHASLVDAARLSKSRVQINPHRDTAAVEKILAARDEERAVVVTESVFSTDGVLAPLRELHSACRRHGALLLVDEAHGLGVRGAGGQGLVHELGLAGEPDIVVTATMSKALGSQGGVVLGPAAVRAHLIDAARTFIFDTGLAPASVGAALAALGVLQRHPELAAAVLDNAAALAGACGADRRPESAVVSVILGDPQRALDAAAAALERGVRVGVFRPPTVPEGTSRLRLTARASLTDAELELARRVLVDVLHTTA